MTYIVFDTETTGLERKYARLDEACAITDNGSEVIQIGGLVLDEDMHPKRLFSHYCDCLLAESHYGALQTHGIPMSSIRAEVPNVFLEEVLVKLLPEFFLEDVTFIGYNGEFDVMMVAQSVRDFSIPFIFPARVGTRAPRTGRHFIDVMDYLPHRNKLVSYKTELTPARDTFRAQYSGKLKIETNAPKLFAHSWQHAHDALFDAIETYLLFTTKVWGQKLIKGRR